jgi:hypothetical protein
MPRQQCVEDARERAYDPGIHRKKRIVQEGGLHRNSGLPELRNIYAPEVG